MVRMRARERSLFADGMLIVIVIALGRFILHCYFNNQYGYFRDEFDYMACGNHLAWGYVDQPPLIPFLIHICRAILGDSLRSMRFIPAVASSLLVLQTAVLAREFGGRRFAIVLSAVTALVAPQYLSNGSLLGTNCLEPNLWMGCAHFAILAIKRNNPRYWLWFGVVAGIGLEEKYSIGLFCFSIVVGLLLTPQRRAFLNPWIWIGGLAAFVIFLPNLLWNIHNHWPFLALMHNIRADGRDVVLPLPQFFLQQMLLIQPLTAPIWIRGLISFFVSPALKPYRVLAWAYLVCFTAFFLLHGKNYYLSPIYPMLLAAGAVAIEALLERRKIGAGMETARPGPNRLVWLKPVIVILLLAAGAQSAPLAMPVLSPEKLLAYMKHLPIKPPVMEHSHEHAPLPQWFADQFGWQEIAAEAGKAYSQLSPEERPGCGVFGQDYGQAGAIDFFGPRYGLPPALSGHQTYWLWGPRGYSGNCLVMLGDRRERLEELFEHVEYVGTSADNPYALEKEVDVYICRGAKFGTLADIWPQLKKWR